MKEAIQKAIHIAVEGGYMGGFKGKGPLCEGEFDILKREGDLIYACEGKINEDTISLRGEISKAGTAYNYSWCIGTWNEMLLNSLFWQALGKSLGWDTNDHWTPNYSEWQWKEYWHRFIAHLAEGKDPELFFKELLK